MFGPMLANLPFKPSMAVLYQSLLLEMPLLNLLDVFLAPHLSTNLIYVGQFVDNNYVVNFSGDDCVVQDRVTGKPIAKRPKVGHLFPLFLPVPALSPISSIKSFACNNVPNLSMVWHRCLGYPNTQILCHV